jgi:CheY-like chemotaxis protein
MKQDDKTKRVPLILFSVRNTQADITKGLAAGADDYLPKPFDFKELQARIIARLRKSATVDALPIEVGDLRIDPNTRDVTFAGKKVPLTLTEFDILKYLASQAGNIVSALGLPGGQQLGLIGSTIQALAPTGLAGSAMGIGIGLAGIQMGKQAVEDTLKAYMPVEQQFMRVQTLTQTSKAEVKGLEQQVRSLSTSTGLTQEDLAKSLYYISSSGFKGNDAFAILNATVKASAAGLGDVAGVADIVTSMMNAYGIKASGAFTVTDKLITAIREGKAEPEQFARSLGQVLPIAREAGIGLDEVLSSVSAITLQGFSAPQAITSIRQAISNLISPSKEAAKELDLFYGEDKGVITVQAKLQTEGLKVHTHIFLQLHSVFWSILPYRLKK